MPNDLIIDRVPVVNETAPNGNAPAETPAVQAVDPDRAVTDVLEAQRARPDVSELATNIIDLGRQATDIQGAQRSVEAIERQLDALRGLTASAQDGAISDAERAAVDRQFDQVLSNISTILQSAPSALTAGASDSAAALRDLSLPGAGLGSADDLAQTLRGIEKAAHRAGELRDSLAAREQEIGRQAETVSRTNELPITPQSQNEAQLTALLAINDPSAALRTQAISVTPERAAAFLQ